MPVTKRWLLGGLLALGAVVLFAPALLSGPGVVSQAGGHGGMMGGYGGGMGGYATGGGVLGPLVPLLVLVLVVGGGMALFQTALDEGNTGHAGTDDAVEELRSAYARGDLSEEEFETRLARLRRNDSR